MRLPNLLANVLFALPFICFFSCTKTDVVNKAPELDAAAVAKKPKEVKTCDISKMTFSNLDETFVYTFTYNKQGQPVSILSNKEGTYGAYHYYFRYDKRHRLTDVIEAFRIEEGQYLYNSWKLFQYNNKGAIVSDTTYYFGLASEHPTDGDIHAYYLSFYTYDKQNRITSVTQRESNEDGETFETVANHAYNNSGNLIGDGYHFDNKINLNRTNPVWMFLNHDYSVNNKVGAESYNEAGLPVKITNPYFSFFPIDSEGGIVFDYSCKNN